MRNLCNSIVDAQPNATTNFPAIFAGQLYAASFMAIFSDSAASGTVKIQYSNDQNLHNSVSPFAPVNWLDVPSATATVTSGASVNIPMPLQISFQWLRVVWTSTGGAGTITVNINAQGY